MSKLGKALIAAIKDANKKGLVTLQASPDVAHLRKSLQLSQSEFSKIYRINAETLKKWEQRKRDPDSISRAYLKCIEKNPALIARLVNN